MNTESNENLTINGVEYIRADSAPSAPEGDCVIVRSRDAGVHVGTLVRQDRDVVELASCARVWRWRGARTLHEMALRGIDTAEVSGYTRVSESVAKVTLTGCCEVIACSDEVSSSIRGAGWAE